MDTRKLQAISVQLDSGDPRTGVFLKDGIEVADSIATDDDFAAEMVRRWNEHPKQQARIEKAEKAAATLAFRMIEAEHALREAIKGLEFAMQRDPDQAGTYDVAATHANLFLQNLKA